MEKIDETEQWLLSGDCSKCRRKKYCSKPCTKCKREFEAEMFSLVSDKLNEMTGGAYGEIMSCVKQKG